MTTEEIIIELEHRIARIANKQSASDYDSGRRDSLESFLRWIKKKEHCDRQSV
jgi:hypothetical protein